MKYDDIKVGEIYFACCMHDRDIALIRPDIRFTEPGGQGARARTIWINSYSQLTHYMWNVENILREATEDEKKLFLMKVVVI